VQQRLRSNGRSGGAAARNKTDALLRGLLRCGRCGSGMVHMHTTRKRSRRYGYYVCQKLHSEGPTACPGARVPAGKFETFVADQIRVIGTDSTLLARTAEQVARAAAERAELLDGELRRGEQERRRLEAQLRGAPTPAAAATVDEQLQALARRQDEVRAEQNAIEPNLDHDDLRAALAGFAPIWTQLFTAERERILRLLIERITYDPDTEQTDITLRASGIKMLAGEARSTA
jgi:site-specific DNA recombinase